MLAIGLGISPLLLRNVEGSTPAPVQDYYLRLVKPDDIGGDPPRMDDTTLVNYDGDLWDFFGWNTTLFPPNGTANWVWKSDNNGISFAQQADAPINSAGQNGRVRLDGKIWFWGTESYEVYTYDSINGWVLQSSGTPEVLAPIKIMSGNDLLLINGQTVVGGTPVLNRNVYKYNDSTQVFDIIGQTPEDFWACTGTAWIGSDGYIYVSGGGKITSFEGSYDFLNDTIIRSADGGVTWNTYATLPVGMQGMWPNARFFDGKIFWINGYADGNNQQGLLYSNNNGLTWSSFYDDFLYFSEITARHATAMCEHDGCLYIGFGNYWNDIYRIEKVTLPSHFANDDVMNWWLRLYPVDRPSQPELDDINTVVQFLMDTATPGGLSNHWDELDVFNLGAGYENENQYLMYLKTSKVSFDNLVKKINTPTWSYYGVSGSGTVNGSLYDENFRISVDNVKFQQNNCSIGCVSLEDVDADVWDHGGSKCLLAVSQNNSRFYANLFCNDQSSLAVSSAKGFRAAIRTDSSNYSLIVDSDSPVSFPSTSQSADESTKYCGYRDGSTNYTSSRKMGGFYYSSGDVDPQVYRQAFYMFYTLVQTRTGNPIL